MGSLGTLLGIAVILHLHVYCFQGLNLNDDLAEKELEKIDDFVDDDPFDGDFESHARQNAVTKSSWRRDEDENDVDEDDKKREKDDDDDDDDEVDKEEREIENGEKPQRQEVSVTNHVTLPRYYDSCDKSMCQMKITRVGCYRDSKSQRTLPRLLDSHRDVTSAVYHGKVFNWYKAEESIRKLACDCAKKTRAKNYTHFGLQFYSECWSSDTAMTDYAKLGESLQCVNGKFKPCQEGEFCVGQQLTNYVYRLDPIFAPMKTTCATKYDKIGCYYDQATPLTRPLSKLLGTIRDKFSEVYLGWELDWKSFSSSLERLICRCAELAKKNGFSHFGIEHYGECWSGASSVLTYRQKMPSKRCVNSALKTCDPQSNCFCAGRENALFIYKLH